MYNRYIPQPDGSYRRNRMQEQKPSPPKEAAKPPAHQAEPAPCPAEPPCAPPSKQPPQHSNIGGFLRQLLPKDFDTGDLIVILLLLLMAGDCEEDRNNAILTIALYFLM